MSIRFFSYRSSIHLFLSVVAFLFSAIAGISVAAWLDAPNAPPNYGLTPPYTQDDFRPMNLGTAPQVKNAGVEFIGGVTATHFVDGNSPYFTDASLPLYQLDLASSGEAGLVKGRLGIGATSTQAKLTVNNPATQDKWGSMSDAIYAYADNSIYGMSTVLSLEQGSPTGYALYSSGGINYFGGNVGIGTTTPGYKLDVAGQIHSSSGGIVFPDGTTQTTAAATGGLLMRAIHTFKDCVVGGGQVYTIDEGKSICRFSGLPAGWTLYPSNWTTTTNVVCNDTGNAPEGWESPPTRTSCNTGSHVFADMPTESCTATSTGEQCWYEGWFGSNKVCGSYTTSTICYATIIERGGY